MQNVIHYISFLLILLLLLPAAMGDNQFYGPSLAAPPKLNNNMTIILKGSTNDINGTLHYKIATSGAWQNCIFSPQNPRCTIPASYLSRQEKYLYYVTSQNDVFPTTGYLNFYLPDQESLFLEIARNFTQSDSLAGWSCKPNAGIYNCDLEHYQGTQLLSYAVASFYTGNDTFKNISKELAISEYNTDSNDSVFCDQANDDFSCGQVNWFGTSSPGSLRQGYIIYSLWSAYQLLNYSPIQELARNYTLAGPEECDVWSGSYNCGTSDAQAMMILAFWKAYEMTGNTSFATIAGALSEKALQMSGSIRLAWAFWATYGLTANQTYFDRAVEISDANIDLCRDTPCNPEDQAIHILSFSEAYRQTKYYRYYRSTIDKAFAGTNTSCNPWTSNFMCSEPLSQGLMALSFYNLHGNFPLYPTAFYQPVLMSQPNISSDLNISVRFLGNMSEPKLFFKQENDPLWKSTPVSRDGYTTINANNLTSPGIYEYYFNDSGTLFPLGNGTLKFILTSQPYDLFRSLALNMSNKDSLSNCDPFGTNSNYQDFNCRLEHMQGWRMRDLSDALHHEGNSFTNVTYNIASSAIDDTDSPNRHQTCDHARNDFDCNYQNPNFPADPHKEKGAYRQASMIFGLWAADEELLNLSILSLALQYAYGHAEECDVWAGSFDCGTSKEQAMMMLAYWKTYEMTGEIIFRQLALNLTESGMDKNNSPYLAWAFWKAYSFTGNATYQAKAGALTDEITAQCDSNFICSPEKLAVYTITYWKAFLYSGNHSYFDLAFQKSFIRPKASSGLCDPLNPNGGYFQCAYPHQQGLLAESYWTAFDTYLLDENKSFSINLTTMPEVSFLNTFNVSCTINNTGNATGLNILALFETDLNLTAVETTGKASQDFYYIEFDSIDPGVQENITWTVQATRGGPQTMFCRVLNFFNSTQIEVTDIGVVGSYNLTAKFGRELNATFTVNYTFTNNASFPLYNLTIYPVFTQGLNLTDIQAPGATISLAIPSLFFPKVETMADIMFNLTFSSLLPGVQSINISHTTAFQGYNNFSQEVLVFYDLFETGFILSNIPKVKEDFNLTYAFHYKENYSLENVVITINASSSVNFLYAAYNATLITGLTNQSFFLPLLEPGTLFNISWSLYSSIASDLFFNVSLSSLYGAYDQSQIEFPATKDAFFLNGSAPSAPMGVGDIFEIVANLGNDVDYPLENVILNITTGDIILLNVTMQPVRINTSYQLHPAQAYNLSGADIVAKLNAADNSTAEPALNATFNFTSNNTLEEAIIIVVYNGSNASLEYLNNQDWVRICGLENSSSENQISCNLTNYLSAPPLNISIRIVSSSNTSIDMLLLNISAYWQRGFTLIKQGEGIYNLGSLNKSGERTLTATFEKNTTFQELVTFTVSSDELAEISKNWTITVIKDTEETTIAASQAGGGGGGPGFSTRISKISYDYRDYDLATELAARPDLVSYLRLSLDTLNQSLLKNTTDEALPCLRITRSYAANKTLISLLNNCTNPIRNFHLADEVPKKVAATTDKIEIQAPGAQVTIIRKDPLILFTYLLLEPDKNYTITYFIENQSNMLSFFDRPLVIAEAWKFDEKLEMLSEKNNTAPLQEKEKLPIPEETTKNEPKKEQAKPPSLAKRIQVSVGEKFRVLNHKLQGLLSPLLSLLFVIQELVLTIPLFVYGLLISVLVLSLYARRNYYKFEHSYYHLLDERHLAPSSGAGHKLIPTDPEGELYLQLRSIIFSLHTKDFKFLNKKYIKALKEFHAIDTGQELTSRIFFVTTLNYIYMGLHLLKVIRMLEKKSDSDAKKKLAALRGELRDLTRDYYGRITPVKKPSIQNKISILPFERIKRFASGWMAKLSAGKRLAKVESEIFFLLKRIAYHIDRYQLFEADQNMNLLTSLWNEYHSAISISHPKSVALFERKIEEANLNIMRLRGRLIDLSFKLKIIKHHLDYNRKKKALPLLKEVKNELLKLSPKDKSSESQDIKSMLVAVEAMERRR